MPSSMPNSESSHLDDEPVVITETPEWAALRGHQKHLAGTGLRFPLRLENDVRRVGCLVQQGSPGAAETRAADLVPPLVGVSSIAGEFCSRSDAHE